MSPCQIVLLEPVIQIRLKFVEALIELLAEGRSVELFLDGAVEALADAVGGMPEVPLKVTTPA